jgi:hypothetical protein
LLNECGSESCRQFDCWIYPLPDGFAVGIDHLQMRAEKLTGVRIDVLHLEPFLLLAAVGRLLGGRGLDGLVLIRFRDRSVGGLAFFVVGEAQASEQQVGEQI